MFRFSLNKAGKWFTTVAMWAAMSVGTGCQSNSGNGSDNSGDNTANRAATIVVTTEDGVLESTQVLQVKAGQAFMLDASSSSDPDQDSLTYSWDFGNQGAIQSGETVTYTYVSPGEYVLTLTVTDARNLSAIRNIDVIVTAVSPVASFSWTPVTGVSPLTVTFDATSSSDPDGAITYYEWDFGDGTVGFGATPGHVFELGGTYNVVLKVADDATPPNIATDMNEVRIVQGNLPPTAVIAQPLITDFTVNLNATASSDPNDNDVLDYAWDFGDSEGTSSDPTPEYTYSEAGEYTVTLTVSDGELSDTTELVIVIEEPTPAPIAAISAAVVDGLAVEVSADTIYALVPFTLAFDSNGSFDQEEPYLTFCWEFGDNTNPVCDLTVDPAPEYEFKNEGTYTSSLVVYDIENNASEPASLTVHALGVSSMDVNPSNILMEPGQTVDMSIDGELSDGVHSAELTEYSKIHYASSDPDVVSVDEATGDVTGIGVGAASVVVSIEESTLDPVFVPVIVSLPLTVTLIPPSDPYVTPGSSVDLALSTTGGFGEAVDTNGDPTDDFIFNWSIDTSGAPGSLLNDGSFVDQGGLSSSIVLDAKGSYEIICTVTDVTEQPVASLPITVAATDIDANVECDLPGDDVPDFEFDTCFVGALSGNIPRGADVGSPPVTNHDEIWVYDGLFIPPDATYSWRANPDIGEFDNPIGDDPFWTLPYVAVDTQLTFTVEITEVLAESVILTVPFSGTVNLVPAPELADICAATESPPCNAGPLQHSLSAGNSIDVAFYVQETTDPTGLVQSMSLRSSPAGGEGDLDDDCQNEKPFVDGQVCTITFSNEIPGTYQFRYRLIDDCTLEQTGDLDNRQRTDTFFSIEVTE